MAAVKVGTISPIIDASPRAASYRIGPTADRKRRERSVSSERAEARRNISSPSGYRSPSLDTSDHHVSPLEMAQQDRFPSANSSVSASASGSASGTATAGSGSSRGGGGEDTLTLRRREANRLAAQRFRSRKKGYQDSLEERIRVLEEEKDTMARRLDHGPQRSPHEDSYYRHHPMYRRRSISPDKQADADVRMASLESANRRLQDELRGVAEENERLRIDVERWRRWERDLRDSRREDEQYPRTTPVLPPLDTQTMAPPSFSPTPYPPSYPGQPVHPPLQRGSSYTSNSTRRLPSPGPRLPPLRLPGSGPLHSPNGRPLLPRPESMERLSTANLTNTHPQLSPKIHRE